MEGRANTRSPREQHAAPSPPGAAGGKSGGRRHRNSGDGGGQQQHAAAAAAPRQQQQQQQRQPGQYLKGDRVLYLQRDGTWVKATVVAVDLSIQPPSYGIRLDGADSGDVRETEGSRLQPLQPS